MIIYTDGSFHDESNIAGWGFVMVDDNNSDKFYQDWGYIEDDEYGSGNITGEVYAVIEALEIARIEYPGQTIRVKTDYIGLVKWSRYEWKRNKKISKFFMNYLEEYGQFVKFEHVKGHTGNKWNEYADRLAAKGVIEGTT